MLMPFPNGGGDNDPDGSSHDYHDDEWNRLFQYHRRLYALHTGWMTWDVELFRSKHDAAAIEHECEIVETG